MPKDTGSSAKGLKKFMSKSSKQTVVIFGTRPEIIKMSPVIRCLEKTRRPYFMVHTGQHYSYEMDRIFFKELELPEPRYQLRYRSEGANRQGEHTARMVTGIEKILLKERPAAVLVQGDTNTVLAGALAAAKMPSIRIGHIEAGLRSYDRQMPEEINRVLTDHVSHLLFAPTPLSRQILLGEGIPSRNIFITGNTIVDSVRQSLEIARRKVRLERWLGRQAKPFMLMTLHRQENVDVPERLESILEGVGRVVCESGTTVLFPIHPRTAARFKKLGLSLPPGVRGLDSIGFLDFLRLEEEARLVLSDSGGVQEEACILGVPCVTIRTTTERPETLHVGANCLAGWRSESIVRSARQMLAKKRRWKNPFGDGRAGERIVRILGKVL